MLHWTNRYLWATFLATVALVTLLIAASLANTTPAILRAADDPVVEAAFPSFGCGTAGCLLHLPLVLNGYPPPPPLELTQGVQQPGNPVMLIKNRPTFARYSLTSTVPYADVSAFLHGTRDGQPLPGSPIAALNNPRTLTTTLEREELDDTFNFELPASWTRGNISLYVQATNSTNYTTTSTSVDAQFIYAAPMAVTIVPVAYKCDDNSTVTLPPLPYASLTERTFLLYPVSSIPTTTHASISYEGPCDSDDRPLLQIDEWEDILHKVDGVRASDGYPDSYYYGLVKGRSPYSGVGYVGRKSATGFMKSETHAHEVGHNHGRRHAPGCGAGYVDSYYPYLWPDDKSHIGDDAHPNYGFKLDTRTIYSYKSRYDLMGYCHPRWISDYNYQAFWEWDNTLHASHESSPLESERALLVSGRIDPASGQVTLQPAYALDVPAFQPLPGDYTLELLDAQGQLIAAYPFAPLSAHGDRPNAPPGPEILAFQLSVPYVDEVDRLRVRHAGLTRATLIAGAHPPTVQAGVSALSADRDALRVSWSASDVDGEPLHYLVRASTDGGATWQTLGVHETAPAIDLRPFDFGGQSVLLQVLASDGLHTTTTQMGPFTVPEK